MLYYFTFTFSSMIHLELIFVSDVKLGPSLNHDLHYTGKKNTGQLEKLLLLSH